MLTTAFSLPITYTTTGLVALFQRICPCFKNQSLLNNASYIGKPCIISSCRTGGSGWRNKCLVILCENEGEQEGWRGGRGFLCEYQERTNQNIIALNHQPSLKTQILKFIHHEEGGERFFGKVSLFFIRYIFFCKHI